MTICGHCKKSVKVVRFDFDEPVKERKWKCDNCYFSKENNSCIISICHKEKNGTKTK